MGIGGAVLGLIGGGIIGAIASAIIGNILSMIHPALSVIGALVWLLIAALGAVWGFKSIPV